MSLQGRGGWGFSPAVLGSELCYRLFCAIDPFLNLCSLQLTGGQRALLNRVNQSRLSSPTLSEHARPAPLRSFLPSNSAVTRVIWEQFIDLSSGISFFSWTSELLLKVCFQEDLTRCCPHFWGGLEYDGNIGDGTIS